MDTKFWYTFAKLWLFVQTLCVHILVETLILGKPYITLFLLIFTGTLHINLSYNRDLPLARRWPLFFGEK